MFEFDREIEILIGFHFSINSHLNQSIFPVFFFRTLSMNLSHFNQSLLAYFNQNVNFSVDFDAEMQNGLKKSNEYSIENCWPAGVLYIYIELDKVERNEVM